MGASSSIQNIENSIYVSYDSGQKDNPYILGLCEELKNNKHNVICSELMNQEFDKSDDVRNIIKAMENIVEHSHLIILCISQRTLSNYYQS
jgi:archaellum biogenesis ATPase FlaH